MPLVDLPDPLPTEEDLGAVHLVGVGGAGMSALARLLTARGHTVSGCDAQDSAALAALRAEGIRAVAGHDPAHVTGPGRPWPVDGLVVSTAIRPDHPERRAAHQAGVPVWPRAVALAALAAGQRTVAVTGTHGKTTTTAMCVVALQAAGLDPSYALGGQLTSQPGAAGNAHAGRGDVFVLEADESDGSFLAYHPFVGLVTNVEADHLDAYGDVQAYQAAFVRFVDTIRPGGLCVVCADDPGAARLVPVAERRGLRVIRYGEQPGVDVHVAADPPGPTGHATGRLTVGGRPVGQLQLAVPGRHNLINAAGALSVGLALGLAPEPLIAGLASFAGTHRRLETRGAVRGVRVLDSYAHHPTEVAADLRAARELVEPHGRLVVAFQPHLYSRTRLFADQLGVALGGADLVVVTDVYPAREDPVAGVTGQLVAAAVPLPPGQVHYVPAVGDLPAVLAVLTRPGDLVLTLGAGDITAVADPLLALLTAKEQVR
jgi:UDP-N-acetylmuramate--alanine ligase